MAMVGKRNFGRVSSTIEDISTIDTSDKLLEFAHRKEITTSPLDVYRIAQELGISVKDKKFENEKEDLSGVLYKESKTGKWMILLNVSHHPNRKRYTIAHELGHWCLHKHQRSLFEDKIFFRGGESTKPEWQANDFASEILIPERDFREKISSGITEVEKLARDFQVSTIALRIRAKKLGMRGHGL